MARPWWVYMVCSLLFVPFSQLGVFGADYGPIDSTFWVFQELYKLSDSEPPSNCQDFSSSWFLLLVALGLMPFKGLFGLYVLGFLSKS